MKTTLGIEPAGPAEVRESLWLVFRDLAPENRDRYVESLANGILSGDLSNEGLLTARRDGRVVGALFCQCQAGRAALLWPPRQAENEPSTTPARLLEAADDLLMRKGVRIANALLEHTSETDDRVLRGAGYLRTADLLYLSCDADEFPIAQPTGPLQFEPICEANHDRLVRVIEATYENTLDCPQLNGIRPTDDVLAGYRATGAFDPGRWLLGRHGGIDVGCLLLADHVDDDAWELVYMGLVRAARGRGWGHQISRHAQWMTAQAGRSRLVVAVDAENHPAVRMYAIAGFRQWDRRTVYLKIFPQSPIAT